MEDISNQRQETAFKSRHSHIAVKHDTFGDFRNLKMKLQIETDNALVTELIDTYKNVLAYKALKANRLHNPSPSLNLAGRRGENV